MGPVGITANLLPGKLTMVCRSFGPTSQVWRWGEADSRGSLVSFNFVMLVTARAVVGIGSAGSSIMTILLWNGTFNRSRTALSLAKLDPLTRLKDFVALTDVALWQSYTDVVGMLGWMAGGPVGELLSRMPTWRTYVFSTYDNLSSMLIDY